MSSAENSPWRILSERFAFNRHTGEFFLLNPEGAAALSMVIEGAAAQDIADALITRFDAPPAAAHRDAEQFVARLRGLDVLQPQPAAGSRA